MVVERSLFPNTSSSTLFHAANQQHVHVCIEVVIETMTSEIIVLDCKYKSKKFTSLVDVFPRWSREILYRPEDDTGRTHEQHCCMIECLAPNI